MPQSNQPKDSVYAGQQQEMDTDQSQDSVGLTMQRFQQWQQEARQKEEEYLTTIRRLENQVRQLMRLNSKKQEVAEQRSRANSTSSINLHSQLITTGQQAEPTAQQSQHMNSETSDATIADPIVKPKKPPPKVTMSGIKDYNLFCKSLMETLGNKLSLKATNNGDVIVATSTDQQYRVLITTLKAKNVAYFAYKLKAEKPYRVIVIRGLHPTISPDTIADNLRAVGHEPIHIVNVQKTIKKRNSDNVIISREKRLYPIFYVDLTPKNNNSEVYDIAYIAYTKVKVEPPYKSKQIPQCKRCQKWNHTRRQCNGLIRCFQVCRKPCI